MCIRDSQTKFVLTKALEAGLAPIVVLNKADRATARTDGALESELFDVFANLGADEAQLDYPTLWASAKGGWASDDPSDARAWGEPGELGGAAPASASMAPLLDRVLEHVPPPCAPGDDAARLAAEPFALAVNAIGGDPYLGRLVTGKIHAVSYTHLRAHETLR